MKANRARHKLNIQKIRSIRRSAFVVAILIVLICPSTADSIERISAVVYGAMRPPAAESSDRQAQWLAVQADINGNLGRWHLVRTPGPEKGADVVSIMHTADALRSDPDFAGIVIRCRPKSALQIAFVLITPIPPRSRPNLTVSVNQTKARFQGEPIPPGSMVALPSEAEVLTKGPWLAANDLTVDIERDGATIHGVVALDNLASAIAYLQSNCSEH
jgi:hypothetical protein